MIGLPAPSSAAFPSVARGCLLRKMRNMGTTRTWLTGRTAS